MECNEKGDMIPTPLFLLPYMWVEVDYDENGDLIPKGAFMKELSYTISRQVNSTPLEPTPD
ncbi:hypothetical protein PAXRUDRAFT_20333 [Paxillus rubicundulus Ve08.2h10]|uniref:Uncharacterized protein n=1 Tax=Paxillus rubicundulus Ve08.2h10 TaxID=930991 RepID=A0A0D0D289_9AGAM|nr:hypothetical protein PAXRUDRAFT_20333 [Paxillus rubicundulus Ve08.2h10]